MEQKNISSIPGRKQGKKMRGDLGQPSARF